MPHMLLITGRPGCGKTTVFRNIIAGLPLGAGGFYTQGLRSVGSERLGFEIVALDGLPKRLLDRLQETQDS